MKEQSKKSLPTPLNFLNEHDREKEDNKKFADKYMHQTFLIDKELADRMKKFLKQHYRFKTKFVNYALARCLDEMSPKEEVSQSEVNEVQVPRQEVMALLEQCWNEEMKLSKEDIEKRLVEDLHIKDLENATLSQNKKGKFISPRLGRKNRRVYDTAEACIRDLISFYIEEKTKSDEKEREKQNKAKGRRKKKAANPNPQSEIEHNDDKPTLNDGNNNNEKDETS